MTVVSNTSPFSELAKIDRLDILEAVFNEVIIPDEVQAELKRHPLKPLRPMPQWIQVVSPDPARVRELRRDTGMGKGECAAIILGMDLLADILLLDDLDARRYGLREGLPVIGTVGVILRAKKERVIASVRPILDGLVENGTWISDSLYEDALRRVGEST